MKKILSLLTLLIVAIGTSWADTEVSPKGGSSNAEVAGASFTIDGTYNAGNGTQMANMSDAGIKIRTNRTDNTLVIGVNNGYIINSVDIYIASNDSPSKLSVTSISVDGKAYTPTGVTFPLTVAAKDKNSNTTVIPVNIAATDNITLGFGGTSSGTGTQGIMELHVTYSEASTEAHTVTFNAGTNGTCATTSLTEESAGAGVTLPEVTPNSGYTFEGWYNGETKVGDAGITYHPSANIELTAKYSALTAPSISVNNTSVSTYKSVAVTFTATADGAPDPTVTWYQNESASTTGGTSVGTGLTYQPDVTAEGIFYYYAVASNGVEPDATSDVVTLTVTDPDKYVTGNAYYISEDEVAVAGEKIYADDITATIVNYSGAAPTADTYLSGINPNYVAQITGSNNGWGPEFVATKDGTLSVGVIINGGKTFTLTNVSSFDYEGVQDEGNNETSESVGTIESNTWAPTKKQWVVLTFDVVAGTTYKLSVAGSKMGFYGFEFTPAATTETIAFSGVTTYVTQNALDFSEVTELSAYAVTQIKTTSVATEKVGQVPAGTPLLIKADGAVNVDVPVIESAEAITNLLLASDGSVEGDGSTIFAYSKNSLKFKKVASTVTIPAGKAYLVITTPNAGDALDVDFEGEATGVNGVAEAKAEVAPVKVIKNGQLFIGNYNVAGARVK